LDKITQAVRVKLEEECDEDSLKVLPKTVDAVRKKVLGCPYLYCFSLRIYVCSCNCIAVTSTHLKGIYHTMCF